MGEIGDHQRPYRENMWWWNARVPRAGGRRGVELDPAIDYLARAGSGSESPRHDGQVSGVAIAGKRLRSTIDKVAVLGAGITNLHNHVAFLFDVCRGTLRLHLPDYYVPL